MNAIISSRLLRSAIAASTLAAASLCAQMIGPPRSNLPPTAPTALPAPNTLPAPIAATPDATSTNRPHHATVTYAAGMLDVRANDSSLNQILLSISRLTGMTITGGVAEERVFGNYGPAEPSTILATLLDGTGSNMLFREASATTPPELILTPRNGGPTPPSPASSVYNDLDTPADITQPREHHFQPIGLPDRAQRPVLERPINGPVSIPQPANNVNGSPANTSPTASTYPTTNSVPVSTLPTPSTTPSTNGIVDAPNPPPPGSTTGASPNGVATPEQIYQQLQQLQKQQQSTTPQ